MKQLILSLTWTSFLIKCHNIMDIMDTNGIRKGFF